MPERADGLSDDRPTERMLKLVQVTPWAGRVLECACLGLGEARIPMWRSPSCFHTNLDTNKLHGGCCSVIAIHSDFTLLAYHMKGRSRYIRELPIAPVDYIKSTEGGGRGGVQTGFYSAPTIRTVRSKYLTQW